MKISYVFIFLGLLALGGLALFFFNQKSSPQTAPTQIEVKPTQATIEQFIKVAPDTSQLKAGGNSYSHPEGSYVFLYPNDYKIDSQNNGIHTRIYKTGATQQGQTEIYDGVIMVFESINLKGQNLENFVTSRIKDSTSGDTSRTFSHLKPVLLNNYTGFVYEEKGFGSSTHLVLQKDTTSGFATEVTFSVNDPQNQNYLNEVYAILSTVELLK